MAENNDSLYQRARDVGGRANDWLDQPVFPRPYNAPRGGGFQGFARRLGAGAIQGAIPSRGEAILRGPNVPGQVLGSAVGGAFEGITDAVRGSAWYQRMFGNGNNSTMGMEENNDTKDPASRYRESSGRGGAPVKQPGRIQNGVYIYPSAGGSPRPPQGGFTLNAPAPVGTNTVLRQGSGGGGGSGAASGTGGGGNAIVRGGTGLRQWMTGGATRIRPN